MPVSFGDCAGADVAFVSGPRPLPFTGDAAVRTATTDDPPPPVEEDDESGGTGTAMALDEGKMGKRDSDRAEGQYRMKKSGDPQRARQEAIEQARATGVLGSAALQQGGAFATLTGTGDISVDGGLLGDGGGKYPPIGVGARWSPPTTGWGTIGTGRYGTIGHGAGDGVGGGRGGMRGRSTRVPRTTIGQPSVQGELDKAIIRRYVKRNLAKITYCYEKELLVKSGLKGVVATQFFIAPSGKVTTATASGVDPNVSDCVAGVIAAIEFPKPKGGGGVQVNYPFSFRPVDDDDDADRVAPPTHGSGPAAGSAAAGPGSATAGAAGSGSAAAGSSSSSSADPGAAGGSAGSTGSAASAGSGPSTAGSAGSPGSTARELYRPLSAGLVDTAHYAPGDANPLRSYAKELGDCVRDNATPHGAAVVELTFAPTGVVVAATAHGVDPGVATCIATVAKRARIMIDPSAAPVQRCAFAFGETPLAALPSVTVTADATLLDGKPEAALSTALAQRLAPLRAPTGPAVAVASPIVVKLDAAAKMDRVNTAISDVAAMQDLVIATKRGADWALLEPMTFPIIPVPWGTGGTWASIKGQARHLAGADDEEQVVLSILVTKERVWVSMSRVNEMTEVVRDATYPASLAKVLKDHKGNAYFVDRTDFEVAGDETATWADVHAVIELAAAANFTGWRLANPQTLAAIPTL